MTQTQTTPSALDTFIDRKLAIDALLAEITTRSEDHFGADPEAVNWGHAGTLGSLLQNLRRAAHDAGIRGFADE